MHACFCLISICVVYFGFPETMGVPLEEMGLSFSLCHDFKFRKTDFFLFPSPLRFLSSLHSPLSISHSCIPPLRNYSPNRRVIRRSNSLPTTPRPLKLLRRSSRWRSPSSLPLPRLLPKRYASRTQRRRRTPEIQPSSSPSNFIRIRFSTRSRWPRSRGGQGLVE